MSETSGAGEASAQPWRSPHLDLNLLTALDALLTEQSVTRAAQRLQLSQPALSASLSRLRVHFGDVLLLRVGNSYQLTPLARRIREDAALALRSARQVFEHGAAFDPTTSRREFILYGTDYSFATIGSEVERSVRTQAPNVRFRFQRHTSEVIEDLHFHLRNADGILLPHGYASDLPSIDVYRDEWMCLISAGNTLLDAELSLQDAADLRWVLTYQSKTAFTPAARQLEMMGIQPQVDAVVEGFLTLPYFIAGTDRVGLVQKKLGERLLALGDLRMVAPPFTPVPLIGALWWHPLSTADPAHLWMREQFLRIGDHP